MITKVLKRAFSTAGRLYTWGPTTFGWGREINDDLYTPGQVDKFNDINRVATGPYHLIFSNTHN